MEEVPSMKFPKVSAVSLLVLPCLFSLMFASCGNGCPTDTVLPDVSLMYFEPPVVVMRGKDTLEAEFGLPLKPGDTVKTGTDGICELGITNVGSVILTENSEARVDAVERGGGRAIVSLLAGSVVSKIQKLAKPDSFLVRTPSLVCGVRGTVFKVSLNTDAFSLQVADGAVSVFPDSLLIGNKHPMSALLKPSILRSVLPKPALPEETVVAAGQEIAVSGESASLPSTTPLTSADTDALLHLVESVVTPENAQPGSLPDLKPDGEISMNGWDSSGEDTGGGKGWVWRRFKTEPSAGASGADLDWPLTTKLSSFPLEKGVIPFTKPLSKSFATYVSESGDASVTVSRGEKTVTVVSPTDANGYNAQIFPFGRMPLRRGALYRISFTAQTETAKSLHLYLGEDGVDVDGDGNKYSAFDVDGTATVEPGEHRYEYWYHHYGPDTAEAQFQIAAGNGKGSIVFGDFTISETSDDAAQDEHQMLVNGDFSRGLSGWQYYGQAVTTHDIYTVRDGAFVRDSDTIIDEAWKNQLGQYVSVEKGRKYLLTFDLEGEGNSFIEFLIQDSDRDLDGDGIDWTIYTQPMRIIASPEGAYRYEIVFLSTATNARARFWIQSGGLTNRYRLDNVTLRPLDMSR